MSEPIQLLEYAGWATLFEEWLQPDKFMAYADMLRGQQIISSQGYERLLIDLRAKRIRSGRQLLTYCEKALVTESPELQARPQDYYRPV